MSRTTPERDVDVSQAEPNPYESPKATGPRGGRRAFGPLDVWFAVFPVLVVAFYAHWFWFMASRGVTTFSSYLPESHPGHVSETVFWRMSAEAFSVGIAWLSSAAVVCVMVRRTLAIRRKRVWCWCAVLVAPVACPLCYYTKLRSSTSGRLRRA